MDVTSKARSSLHLLPSLMSAGVAYVLKDRVALVASSGIALSAPSSAAAPLSSAPLASAALSSATARLAYSLLLGTVTLPTSQRRVVVLVTKSRPVAKIASHAVFRVEETRIVAAAAAAAAADADAPYLAMLQRYTTTPHCGELHRNCTETVRRMAILPPRGPFQSVLSDITIASTPPLPPQSPTVCLTPSRSTTR